MNEKEDDLQMFRRQRSRLMVVSLSLTFIIVAGIQFNEINLLGNKTEVENPEYVEGAIWCLLAYWLWRYYAFFKKTYANFFTNSFREELGKRYLSRKIVRAHIRENLPEHATMPRARDVQTTGYGGGNARVFWNEQERTWNFEKGNPNYMIRTGREWSRPREVKIKAHYSFRIIEIWPDIVKTWLFVVFRTEIVSEYYFPFITVLFPLMALACRCFLSYYSANIKGDIKQLNSLWDGESKDLMAWRRIPSSAYRPGSRASRLSMPE